VTWLLASGPSFAAALLGLAGGGEVFEDLVRVVDRRRHQLGRLAAGVAEHDALVARALVLVAGGVDALRDMRRLSVQVDLDLGLLPVEAFLLVADILDGVAGELDHLVLGDGFRAAHLAGDDHSVGGGQGLAGHTRFRLGSEIGVDDGIGDTVANLVRMAFGHRLAGEKIARPPHDRIPLRQIRKPGYEPQTYILLMPQAGGKVKRTRSL
jgi:hypothetical protein